MFIPCVVLAAATASIYLIFYCHRSASLLKSVFKAMSTGALALAAVAVDGSDLLFAALALAVVGDLMLSRDGRGYFLAGLSAFAVSHLAYIGLFVVAAQVTFPPQQSGAWLAALALLAFGGLMGRVLWDASGDLRWPVMIYLAIILSMGTAALGLPVQSVGESRYTLAVLAAGSFILSDALLAAELFLLSDRQVLRRIVPFGVWFCYWSAQALFLVAFTL